MCIRSALTCLVLGQTSAYGFPFEVYHSRAFGKDMPPYWVRIKAGSMPGYVSVLAMFPEIKTGA